MDPDVPTSDGTKEYNVLKLKIFEIFPKKVKLAIGECCNIRFRYNIKDVNEHSLMTSMFEMTNICEIKLKY